MKRNLFNRIRRKTIELFSSCHRFAEVMSFNDYACQYDNSNYHLIDNNRMSVVKSSQFIGEETVESSSCLLPDTYWTELSNAELIGGSDVVISSNHKMLYDLLAHHEKYGANITDHGLLLIYGKPRHFQKSYCYTFDKHGCQHLLSGINLASNMSNNYFHFMFQVASKIVLIKKTNIPQLVPLLIDERVLSIPQMKQIVDLLNEEQRSIIPLKEHVRYNLKKMYCISNPNIVIPNSIKGNQKICAFAYDRIIIETLSTLLLSHVDKSQAQLSYPKRIFLSRKNCNKRKINEEELRPILEKHGFEFVYTETLDVLAQAKMFHQAEHVIASSGAALTNLIFCSKRCKVLVFLSRHKNSFCYSSLAAVKELSIQYLAGYTKQKGLHVQHYDVSPKSLNDYLNSIYK